MSVLPFPCPGPPRWYVDWDALTEQYDWIAAMRDCPQDAIYHAEGSVWTHVGMVAQAMADLGHFRAMEPAEREMLFAAALLHDVAKPVCTRHEEGRITSRGHSQRGAISARQILWELGVPFGVREQVCALVRFHQAPFHLINRSDARRLAFLISQSARCDWLSVLAMSDALGRICEDRAELLTRIELFREYCREQHCFDGPRQFPSGHSRFLYFRLPDRDPDYRAYEEFRCHATVMCGLPGAGKDMWIVEHAPDLPQVSLDDIREEIGAAGTGHQGAVVQAARERAREFLRAKQDFVWNATNISREIRGQVIDLLAKYDAHIRLVYVEAGRDRLFEQNRERPGGVPENAIARLMDRWEVPDATEAQQVEWWVDGRPVRLPWLHM